MGSGRNEGEEWSGRNKVSERNEVKKKLAKLLL